jgi:hypothetical protein
MPRPLTVLLLASLALTSHATSGREVTPEQLFARADRVGLADVVSTRTEGEPPRLRTVTRLLITEGWKGQGPAAVELEQLGGESGGFRTQVAGDARFVPGEQALVFLRCRGEVGRCTLLGLERGRLTVLRAADGSAVVELKEGSERRRVPLSQLRTRLREALPQAIPAESGR